MKAPSLLDGIQHRFEAKQSLWRAAWIAGGAAVASAAAYLAALPGADPRLGLNAGNVRTLAPLFGVAGLIYLLLARPVVRRYVQDHCSAAVRVNRRWRDDLVTRTIAEHGLTSAFVLYVAADAIAYFLVAFGAWSALGNAGPIETIFLRSVAILAALWAAMYGLVWLVPRRLFAACHGYIRSVERALIARFGRGAPTGASAVELLSDADLESLLRAARAKERAKTFVRVVGSLYLSLLFYRLLPVPGSVLTATALITLAASVLLLLTSLLLGANAFADVSRQQLLELDALVRGKEITKKEAIVAAGAIEVLRNERIIIPGGIVPVIAVLRNRSPLPRLFPPEVFGSSIEDGEPAP